MTDKLSLFNGALELLGERSLVSLTENREPRRILESHWTGNKAIRACLEMGQWNFATRAVELNASPSVTPTFGFEYAFEKPSDFIRTTHMCSDERFDCPFRNYMDVSGFWYSDLTPMYCKYVSMADDTGLDMSKWTQAFTSLVECYLASKACKRITESTRKTDQIEEQLKKLRLSAKNLDAMENPTQTVARESGRWVGARGGGRRGNTGRFTGGIY